MLANRTSSSDSFFGIPPQSSPKGTNIEVSATHHPESPKQPLKSRNQSPVEQPLGKRSFSPSFNPELNREVHIDRLENTFTQTSNIPHASEHNIPSDGSYTDEFESDSGASIVEQRTKKREEEKGKKSTYTKRWTNPYPPPRGQKPTRTRGAQSKPTTARQRETDYVSQRLLSARRLKINELRNELEDVERQRRELELENKTLKRIQQRQERELLRIEVVKGELPDVLQAHKEEVRVLKALLKQSKEKSRNHEQRLKVREKELQLKTGELRRLWQLSESKDLLDRDTLKQKVASLEQELNDRETTIKELNRKIELLTKNHKHELMVERQKYRDTLRQLTDFQSDYENLQDLLKEKENQIEQWNTNTHRTMVPESSSASINSPPRISTKKFESRQKASMTLRKLPKPQPVAKHPEIHRKRPEAKKAVANPSVFQDVNSTDLEDRIKVTEELIKEEEISLRRNSLQEGSKPKRLSISLDDKEHDELQKVFRNISPTITTTDKPFSPKLRKDKPYSPKLNKADTLSSFKSEKTDRTPSPKPEKTDKSHLPNSEKTAQVYSPDITQLDSSKSSSGGIENSPSRDQYNPVASPVTLDVDHNRNIIVIKDKDNTGHKKYHPELPDIDTTLNQQSRKVLLSKLKEIDNEVDSDKLQYSSMNNSPKFKGRKHYKQMPLTKSISDFSNDQSQGIGHINASKLNFDDYDDDEVLSFGGYKPSFGKVSGRISVESNYSDKEKQANNRDSHLMVKLFGNNTENPKDLSFPNSDKVFPWEGEEDGLKSKKNFRRRGSYQDELTVETNVSRNSPEFLFGKRPFTRKSRIPKNQSYEY